MIISFAPSAHGFENKKNCLISFLIAHPASTVFMTVDTNRFTNMGIYCGDVLTIDKSKTIKQNSLVVYESAGQIVLGRVYNINNTCNSHC